MSKRYLTAVLVAAASVLAAPAFASGYGPAPYYSASEGAPASQRGVSALTVAAEQAKGQEDAVWAKAAQSDGARSTQTAEVTQ